MTKTKNERITNLEKEVAELKLIVHELRGKKSIEPSTKKTVEDIIEFDGQQYRKVDREACEGDVVMQDVEHSAWMEKGHFYRVLSEGKVFIKKGVETLLYTGWNGRTVETVNVYELIQDKPLTPNQQRAEIIEKAKKFVEDTKLKQVNRNVLSGGNHLFNAHMTTTEFVVNSEKRIVVALIRYESQKNKGVVRGKGIAKCNPSDVFNEHIGKAIALGRALGLDVSEFEQVVQPTTAIGQIVAVLNTDGKPNGKIDKVVAVKQNNCPEFKRSWASHYQILNDTNAKYEVSSNE